MGCKLMKYISGFWNLKKQTWGLILLSLNIFFYRPYRYQIKVLMKGVQEYHMILKGMIKQCPITKTLFSPRMWNDHQLMVTNTGFKVLYIIYNTQNFDHIWTTSFSYRLIRIFKTNLMICLMRTLIPFEIYKL